MNSTKLIKFAMSSFSLALILTGCGGGSNGNPGTGGSSSPGAGGASSPGAGGTSSPGAGGTSSPGAGGASSPGAGGTSSPGAGGSNAGAGGASSPGAGGSNAGEGGTSSPGAGGSNAGAGGSSGSGGATGGANGGRGGGEGGRGGSSAGGRGGSGGGAGGGATGSGGNGSGGTSGGPFSLTSPSLVDMAKFAGKYTCNGGTIGGGINPELDWTGVPAGTKSLAMTFIDTTLGESSQFGQHWAIWNVPWDPATGKVSMFMEGLGMTLSGDLATAKQSGKFLAPCATSVTNGMDDQYAFTLYALSTTTLNVQGSGTVANALTALHAITPLGTAVLHGHAGVKGQ